MADGRCKKQAFDERNRRGKWQFVVNLGEMVWLVSIR